MGDLSRNLSRKEFACQCGCGFATVDIGLSPILQFVVDHFQDKYKDKIVRIKITSGCRCERHNNVVGGSSKSMHKEGRAADFYLYDKNIGTDARIDADEVAYFLEQQFTTKFGIGRYDGRTHFDNRSNKVRWDKR